ncbi:MAG TPA: ribbon-helix-helix domain-containing protein [Caulobacteraceae bacterium]
MPALRKRSLLLAGHGTSLALEPEFWAVLEAAAARQGLSLAALVARIDAGRGERALASACRVFALQFASNSDHPREGGDPS